MRLLYLLGSSGGVVGGLEKHVFQLAAGMAARGHRVTLMADIAYAPACPPGVELVPASRRWSRTENLRKLINSLRPDVVHAHAGKAAGWLQPLARKPHAWLAIATAHGVKRHYRGFDTMDLVVGVSEALRPRLPASAVIIPSGVQGSAVSEAERQGVLALAADWPRPWVVAVGRLVPVKGFDVLLEAWRTIRDGTLIVLGEGESRQSLEDFCSRHALTDVRMPGESRAVAAWLALSDLFVLSSRREGGPYVLIEALQAGLPVVSTRVGLAPDLLPATWLVDVDDADALADRVRSALANIEQVTADCADARTLAETTFSLNGMLDQLEALYASRAVKHH